MITLDFHDQCGVDVRRLESVRQIQIADVFDGPACIDLQDFAQLPAKSSLTKNKTSHVVIVFKVHYQKKSFRRFRKERSAGERANSARYCFDWYSAGIHPDGRPIPHAAVAHEGMVSELHDRIDNGWDALSNQKAAPYLTPG